MLKDLDNRSDAEKAANAASAKSSTLNLQKKTQPKNSITLILLLVVIITLLALIAWQMVGRSDPQYAELQQLPQQLPQQAKLANQTAKSIENKDSGSSTGSESNSTDSAVNSTAAGSSPEKNAESNQVGENEVTAIEAAKIQASRKSSDTEINTVSPSVSPELSSSISTSTSPAEPSSEPQAQSFVIEKTSNTLTPEERVEKLLNKAKSAYDRGYITEAIEQLTKLLTITDDNIEARNLLAGAWYGRGEMNRSIAILNDGLQRYPLVETWRITAAKMFFKENNLVGAFSYLDVNLSNASKEFYTLKGNLARELKLYPQAEEAYRNLTLIEPYVGNWWLGMAIAQDSQNKFEMALESYKKVINIGGVSSQSIEFSNQRINVLEG